MAASCSIPCAFDRRERHHVAAFERRGFGDPGEFTKRRERLGDR
jgi:hypothetical protein